jgi:hypothetical protein
MDANKKEFTQRKGEAWESQKNTELEQKITKVTKTRRGKTRTADERGFTQIERGDGGR